MHSVMHGNDIDALAEELEIELLRADGLDNACVGYCYDMGSGTYRLIYRAELVIDVLVEEQGMDRDEAVEHFHFNIQDAYVGAGTPIWMNDLQLN